MENNIKKGTPKDVFLHLLAVVTLYISVVAFIALWWQYIQILFPDLLQIGNYYSMSYIYDPIRLAMASLIVVLPIHILISWLIGREFRENSEKREIRVRKWLWYITLFISAVTIIIDLITLINNFLRGELTAQFFLKVIVVLVVAGAVFTYYLWDLKKRDKSSNVPKLVTWIVMLVALASIVYGFFLIGTPATQRARRFDEQRVGNLSVIQSEIISYWQQKDRLPVKLDDLKNQISGFVPPVDPESNVSHEYIVKGTLTFELCANFKTSNTYGVDNMNGNRTPVAFPIKGYDTYGNNWSHGEGRVCFERTIDPELYKNRGGVVPLPLGY